MVLLLVPVGMYFSIKISRRKKGLDTNDFAREEKSPFFPPLIFVIILATLFISAFSVYAYLSVGSLASKNEATPLYQIAKDVKELREEFKKINLQNETNDLRAREMEEIQQKILDIVKSKRTQLDIKASFWELNNRQKEILSTLKQPDVNITNKDAQKKFKISQITASRDLSKLTTLGLN